MSTVARGPSVPAGSNRLRGRNDGPGRQPAAAPFVPSSCSKYRRHSTPTEAGSRRNSRYRSSTKRRFAGLGSVSVMRSIPSPRTPPRKRPGLAAVRASPYVVTPGSARSPRSVYPPNPAGVAAGATFPARCCGKWVRWSGTTSRSRSTARVRIAMPSIHGIQTS